MAKVTDLTALTAPALTDYIELVDVSDTTDDAAGTSKKMLAAYAGYQYSGTSFPVANLWDGMPFIRTDIGNGLLCQYDEDNTQWLTTQEFEVRELAAVQSADGTSYGVTRSDYAPLFTRYEIITNPAATNDGSKYWTVTLYTYDEPAGTSTSLYSFDTSGDTEGAYLARSGTPGTQTSANYGAIGWNFAKTSTPGNLTVYAKCFYRLIIT